MGEQSGGVGGHRVGAQATEGVLEPVCVKGLECGLGFNPLGWHFANH